MLSVSKFVLENNHMEILPMDQIEFPHICYFREMDDSPLGKSFPWHWHNAMEIDYAAEGEIEIKTPGRTIILQKGDAAFINSNVMHNISSRECTRCFQRCIGISPVNYLINYRVRTAARMLLTTGRSITSISEDCGFSSPSYFGKTFYDYTHCTPREYRRQKDSSSQAAQISSSSRSG